MMAVCGEYEGHLDVALLLLDRGAKVDATGKVACWRTMLQSGAVWPHL
jgi:hypothetical protein